FADIAIQRFKEEAQLAEIVHNKTADHELHNHPAEEAAIKKHQDPGEIAPAHMQRVFGADKAEGAGRLEQEAPKASEQTMETARLKVTIGQVKKFDHVGIAEHLQGRRMSLSQHC